MAASGVESKRSCDDDVSGSPSERSAVPALADALNQVEQLAGRAAKPVSPGCSEPISLASRGPSARTPLIAEDLGSSAASKQGSCSETGKARKHSPPSMVSYFVQPTG
jgi:hypothetical protein